ncbi:cardiolipin synthase [Alkalicoccobacillus gibsonii]|uniref:cardiolipin synthase n=1 Tax=Alkalicoccobacillus gibsonii TaxID=79881 RepID=UPI003F7CAE1B
MKIALTIAILLIAVIVYLRIDFLVGLARLRKQRQPEIQDERHTSTFLLATGEDFFEKLFADIEASRHHVHMIFYIFKEDHIGTRLIELLEKKANEGIDIKLLVDWVGSKLSRKTIKRLQEAGIVFAKSHTPRFPTFFFSLNHRNHRKITVIDGKIGYLGGFNVGDEYLGRNPRFGFWRDFHMRFEGDGVQDLQDQFFVDLALAGINNQQKKSDYPVLEKGPHPVRFFTTNGTGLESLLLERLKEAKHSILLGSPYYVPGETVQEALIQASQNGIEISLLLPQKSDHPLVKEGSMGYIQRLIESGVSVYHYDQGFYHAKALVIDQSFGWISTANIDKRSFHLNSEMTCMLENESTVSVVVTRMLHDIEISEKLTTQSLKQRGLYSKAKEQLAGMVSGLL